MSAEAVRPSGRASGLEEAGRADAFARRNAVDGELLVRVHPTRIVGWKDVAG